MIATLIGWIIGLYITVILAHAVSSAFGDFIGTVLWAIIALIGLLACTAWALARLRHKIK